jgi:hypothetical protein
MLMRSFVAGIALTPTGFAGIGNTLATPKDLQVTMSRSKLIQEFGQSGIKTCPKCDFPMIPAN